MDSRRDSWTYEVASIISLEAIVCLFSRVISCPNLIPIISFANSSTLATLFFMGFGSSLLKDIPINKIEVIIPAFAMLMEVILATFVIRNCISAFKVRGYYYTMTHDIFS